MTLKERVRTLAQRANISISTLESTLGFGSGAISKWNKSVPSGDKLQKVAEFFGVTIDYLINGNPASANDTHKLNTCEQRDISNDLNRIMGEIQNGDNGPIYYNGVEISKASINLLSNAIEYLPKETKKENKVKYSPPKNKK